MSTPDLQPTAPERPAGMPLVGYRSWRLLWNGELRSVGRGQITWMPGVNTAACAHAFAHQAPDPDCDCGLYAYHHPGHATDREDEIVGAVVAWGQLHVYRDGFRAQHARVVALARRPGADRRRRAAEQAAAQRYGATLVQPAELELVTREHGDPIDPAVIAQVDQQVVPVPDGPRARTRREILTDRAYETLARPIRAAPGLRTLLLCVYAYGPALSLLLWALLAIAWVRHAHAWESGATLLNHVVMPGALAGLPALAAAIIHAARQLAASRFGDPPWPARLLGPITVTVAIALPWLPAHVEVVLAAAWLLGIGSGIVLAGTVQMALEQGALELIAVVTPGLIIALGLANNGASGRAIVSALCLTAAVTLLFAERKGLAR